MTTLATAEEGTADDPILFRHTPNGKVAVEYAPLTPFSDVSNCLRNLVEDAVENGDLSDEERTRIETLAECLDRSEGRTVMVSAETIEAVFAAREAADLPFATSPAGRNPQHAVPKVRHGVKNGVTTDLFEMTDEKWNAIDLDGLHESDTGTIHAVADGEVYCTGRQLDEADIDRDVNLAYVCLDESVCGNCETALLSAGERLCGGTFDQFEIFLDELRDRHSNA